MECKIELIDKHRAKQLLDQNGENRDVNSAKKFYVQEMKTGLWKENGEAIIIDKNGVLKDGQHRLMSVIEADYAYYCPVVTGVEPDVMATIDTGRSRTLNDILKLNGFMYTGAISGLIRSILRFKGGSAMSFDAIRDQKTTSYISNSEGLAYAELYKTQLYQLIKTSERVYGQQPRPIFSLKEVAFMFYVISKYEPKEAHRKFILALSGVNTPENSGTLWLYKKHVTAKANGDRMGSDWKMVAFIRIWNNYVLGDYPMAHFKINPKEVPKILDASEMQPRKEEVPLEA